jgi:hypothetical protein
MSIGPPEPLRILIANERKERLKLTTGSSSGSLWDTYAKTPLLASETAPVSDNSGPADPG